MIGSWFPLNLSYPKTSFSFFLISSTLLIYMMQQKTVWLNPYICPKFIIDRLVEISKKYSKYSQAYAVEGSQGD